MPTETVLLQGKDLGLVSKLGLTKNGGHQSYKLEIRSEYIYIYIYINTSILKLLEIGTLVFFETILIDLAQVYQLFDGTTPSTTAHNIHNIPVKQSPSLA